MLRKILIVDDGAINRLMLRKILCDDYEVLEAENGRQALTVLKQYHNVISAVLLDIIMPELDGYEVLAQMAGDGDLQPIPAIVMTGTTDEDAENKALALGATDFITKPYNPNTIKHRLRNIINLRETAAMVNLAKRDELTGLYNRRAFFELAAEMIAAREPGYYVMACFDVDNFKVINDQYGSEKGDAILKCIADACIEGFSPVGGVCCRIMADNFAVLYPRSFMNSDTLVQMVQRISLLDGSIQPITFSIGRYIVDDLSLPVSGMYDRATLAQASIKGRFDVSIAVYDESMRARLLREQEITGEMKNALAAGRFEVWLQPQFNHATGALVGAEALARWRHPDKEAMIAPGEFVPVFERNGFIYELDKYIWEQSCRLLRRWLDQGRSPLPLSVNISRYDVFCQDFVAVITGLVERYGLPVDLLRLEITETAFAQSMEQIIAVVKELIDYGFIVEIDDFGSGYSSLNTLKDVPAQVLKLDMRFLENDSNSQRGGNIIESIVRMAKWLNMSVIAEGVETMAQADYLKSIGCNYIQGYLYARPMPVEEYEALTYGAKQEYKLLALETLDNLDNNAFWDPNSMDTLIFNSYVGGACIFEYRQGSIELLRATEKYARVIGSAGMTVADALKLDWSRHLDEENRRKVSRAVELSIATKDEITSEYVFLHLPGCPEKTYLRSTLRVIASAGDRYLIYCTNENITAEKLAAAKIRETTEQLYFLNDTAGDLLARTDAAAGITTVLQKVRDYFGAARSFIYEYRYEEDACVNTYEIYAPEVTPYTEKCQSFSMEWSWYWLKTFEDSDFFRYDHTERLGEDRRLERDTYRAIGAESVLAVALRSGGRIIGTMGVENPTRHLDDYNNLKALGDYMAVILTRRDLTAKIESDRQNLLDLMNDMPGAFVRMRVLPGGVLATEYVNENFCRLRGMSNEEIMAADRHSAMHAIHPDDLDLVASTVAKMLVTGETCNVQIRLKHANGQYFPANVFARVTRDETGEAFVHIYFAELSAQEKQDLSLRETMPFILSAIMKSSTDSVFAKDKDLRYICCSPAFLRLAGREDEREVIGKSDYELFPRETADQFRAFDLELLESGESLLDYLEIIPSTDGVRHYAQTSKYLIRDTAGEIIGLYGTGRDITEERTAFEQLKLLTDSIPGGIAAYEGSPEGIKLVYFNDGFCNMLGYTREEYEQISKADITSLVFEEDVPAVKARVKALLREDAPLDHTYRIHHKEGGYKWVNIRGTVAERRGELCLFNVVLYDVTEVQRAQEAVLVHEQEMKLAMSQMGKMLCEYDPATRTLTVPESYAALYGQPAEVPDVPDSLINANVIDPATIDAYRAFFDAILRGDRVGAAEYRDRRSDGSYRWERVEFASILDSAGKPVKTIIAVEDVTPQHLQYELEQSRPKLGEENLLAHALFNLSTGETLDYAYRDGSAVPAEDRTGLAYGEENLETLLVDAVEREQYRALNDPAALLKRYAEGETELSLDYRRRLPDGAIGWVRNILRMVRQPGGSDILLFDYYYNIEEEKTREQIYTLLVNESYDYVAWLNGNNHHFTVMLNAAFKDSSIPLKGEDADVVARGIVEASVHPDDKTMVLQNTLLYGIKRNLKTSDRFQFTCRMLQPDGSLLYKRITEYYLDRERDIIIMTREDISALMREETRKNELLKQALEAANEESRVKERAAAARLSTIMNNLHGGVCVLTLADGRPQHVFINDAFYALYGFTPEQFEQELPQGVFELIHPEDLPRVDAARITTETEGSAMVDYRAYRRDGSLIWVRNTSSICEIDGIDLPVHIVISNDITREREAADHLRMSEEQFRIAAAIGGRSISRYDVKTGAYYHNDKALLALGFSEIVENAPQAFIDAGLVAPEGAAAFLEFYEKIKRGEKPCRVDTALIWRDGSYLWVHGEATLIFDAQGEPSQAIIVFNDITEQREKEAVYKKWQQSLEEKSPESYTLVRCNLSKDTVHDSAEGSLLRDEFGAEDHTFKARTREYAERFVCLEDRDRYLAALNADALLAGYYRGRRNATLEYREILTKDTHRWLRLSIELVEYPHSSDIEAYLMYEDIDAGKRDELRNKLRAETDPLTGVLNRTAFVQAVERMMTGPDAAGSLALLMLDVDGFKLINDTFGHAMGDQVLIDIAGSLRGVLRAGDILGRLGGDEFLVGLRDMPSDEAVEKKAGQICSLLHRFLSLEVYTSASIGIAVYPRDGNDFDTLYRKMDTALYVVKEHGKNNYAFFRDGMADEYARLGGSEKDADSSGLMDSRHRPRLLIVDDNQINLTMLARIFEDEFAIEKAKDGGEALVCLRRYGTNIAVVLLDLVMPGMDGFAVLKKMRDSAELRTIPVIVVSGMDEHETSLRTIKCGAADFVTKPVDPDLIRLRVQSVISKAENERLRAQNSTLLLHNTETAKYRAALESVGATVIEFEPASGVFSYDSSITNYIAGHFDHRELWEILLADDVATAEEVAKMQKLVADTAAGQEQTRGGMTVTLRTPSREQRLFRMSVRPRISAAGFPNRILLTLRAVDTQ